jgi:uncharacterized membrane protein
MVFASWIIAVATRRKCDEARDDIRWGPIMKRHSRPHCPSHRQPSGRTARLAAVVERNIASINRNKKEHEAAKGFEERLADHLTSFTGSMWFVYLHTAWFAFWITANLGLLGLPAFDPPPFGVLTLIVSLEAIFLSTFVLISQNRDADAQERREELDLQINLLSEHEVTRILYLADLIADKLDVRRPESLELEDLEEDVEPDSLLAELHRAHLETRREEK